MKKTLFTLLALASFCLQAQTEFRSGYIIEKSLDTVYGELDYRGDELMAKVCTFRKNGKIQTFQPGEITSFRFTNSKYYVSKNINGADVFLEHLIKGKLSIYYFLDLLTPRYFAENADGVFKEIPFRTEVVTVDDRTYEKTSKDHFGLLKLYTDNLPEFNSQIERIDKPNHKSLIKLAKNYHEKVCTTEECLIYETKSNKSHLSFEAVGGSIQYQPIFEALEYKQMFIGGVLIHVSIPTMGDKWYVKTGVLGHNTTTTYRGKLKTETTYKFPIQMEYIHPKGLIRPKFAYGLLIMNSLYTSASTGVNIRLNNRLFVSLNADFEFTAKNLLIPDEHAANTFSGGIFYTIN